MARRRNYKRDSRGRFSGSGSSLSKNERKARRRRRAGNAIIAAGIIGSLAVQQSQTRKMKRNPYNLRVGELRGVGSPISGKRVRRG